MLKNKNVLVTGASGFVGLALCKALASKNYNVVTAVRSKSRAHIVEDFTLSLVEDIGPQTDWRAALSGVDTVFHIATWTPPDGVTASSEMVSGELQRVNLGGTRKLMAEANTAGVRRFVFASSVLVYGDVARNAPINEDSSPFPNTPYGRSKLEVEHMIRDMSRHSDMDSIILRIPLVYGGSERCALMQLLRLCANSIPLPFAAVRNKLSMVFVNNLADALIACSEHPAAIGKTFLVRDDEIVSTPELVTRFCAAFGSSPRLFAVPEFLLRAASYAIQRKNLVRLCLSSGIIDDGKFRRELDWCPPYTMSEGIAKTVSWYTKEYG